MRPAPTTIYHYAESSCAELILTSHTAREYPWHSHAHHWIIGLVCSGQVFLGTREKEQPVGRGNSFIVPPNVAHCLKVATDTALAVLCLNSGKNIEEKIHSLVSNLLCSEDEYSFASEFHPSDFGRLQENALMLSKLRGFERFAFALTPAVHAVIERIQERPEEPLSLDAMAAIAGYSRWHFLRLFQKEVGMTPHAYQMICRLRLLRALLRADTAAAEAAVSAGFSDQSHMHRIFKLHHGLTPGQFRKASIRAYSL